MAGVNVTSANFEKEVLKESKLVVLKFGAEWCGPCKKLDPVVEEIAKERTDVKICSVDIDSEIDLPSKYSVLSVPTVLFFKDGQIKESIIGFTPKAKILQIIEKYSV